MLTRVDVGKGWTRYVGKSRNDDDPPVEPGIYYRVHAYSPNEQTKKSLGMMAVRDPNGAFMWLAPHELWVKRVADGCFNRPIRTASNVDWSVIGVDPNRLRSWQRNFIGQAWACLEANQPFRRVGHVSLGGGKTLAGLMLLALGEVGVVLAPRHVHETWITEAAKWGFAAPRCSTYESAYKLVDLNPDVVVCDELHLVKNSEALRHEHAARLGRQASICVGFTASLLGGGGPLDLRALRVIEAGSVPAGETPWRFLFGLDTKLEEVAPGRKAYVTKTWDTKKISAFVAPWIETVDTSGLLAELPPITEQVVTLQQPKDYRVVSAGGATTRSSSKRVAQLRQVSDGHVEMDDGSVVDLSSEKIDWVADFVEHLGEPVVIYAAWCRSVERLTDKLKAYQPSVIEGGSSDVPGQIERFKNGLTKVLIANSAYSEGMNLQEVCRVMVFLSVSSNPVKLKQAIGRIHRPGQTQGCQIVFLQCAETMDQRMLELVWGHEELSEEQVEALLAEELDEK